MSTTPAAAPADPSGTAGARAVCVVVAAGSGTRLAAGRPKAFVPVCGEALLVHAVRGLVAADVLDLLVVVVPAGLEAGTKAMLATVGGSAGVRVVAGGASRQASVAAGLDAVPGTATAVLVHDAARALAPPDLVRRVLAAVDGDSRSAVVPAVPVHDTLRSTSGEAVDRDRLRAVQTPQGFSAAALRRAHAAAVLTGGEVGASDDAGLVEALGLPVHVVAGDPEAFKVTRPLDLLLAEAVLRHRAGTR